MQESHYMVTGFTAITTLAHFGLTGRFSNGRMYWKLLVDQEDQGLLATRGGTQMPALKPTDRLVQVKGRPGTYFRLQKSGGSNSRVQHVDLAAGEYRLDGSFLVENSRLTKQTTYSEHLLHEGPLDNTISIGEDCPRTDGVSITVDAEVYAKIKASMTRLACTTPNEALRKLFKIEQS
jgi:hypothetical protein